MAVPLSSSTVTLSLITSKCVLIFLNTDVDLCFMVRPFANLCVEKFFIELDQKTVHSRRQKRADQPDPPGYFLQWTWPMYLQNKKEIENQQISKCSKFVVLKS